jgi:hypothetical protein
MSFQCVLSVSKARIRFRAERIRSLEEAALLREEMRIKDARMAILPPHRRPYYPPRDRLAILELRAARGWSLEQTAESFLVCPKTIASWMTRLDEYGPDALVQMRSPVNKFPEFVHYAVQTAPNIVPDAGEEETGRDSGTGWAASGSDDHPPDSHGDTETFTTGALRESQGIWPSRASRQAQSRLARRFDGHPDAIGLLVPLGTVGSPPVLAVLFVAGSCSGSLLAARHGDYPISPSADVGCRSKLSRPGHRDRGNGAKASSQ